MPRRLWAAVSISSGSMLYAMDANLANVALPAISQALHLTPPTAVMIVSAYNLVLAMVLLPLAAAGERLGYRRVFVVGLSGYFAAAIACLFLDGLVALVALRGVMALCSASILSVSLAMVRITYPADMLGRGLGLNTMMASLGAAMAPPLSGIVLSQTSWQPVFAIGIPLAVLGIAAARALPEPEPHHGSFDALGAGLCAVTFGLLISSLQAMGQGAAPAFVASGLAAGAVVAVIFIRHALRTPRAVLPVDLLADRSLALSVAGALLAVLSSTIVLLYLPFRLSELGIGSATIGAMLAPYALAVIVCAPASGMLSDKIAPAKLGTLGLVLAVGGVVSLAYLPDAITYPDIAWRTTLCGAGFSIFFSPNGRLVVGSVARDRVAGASSLLATTRMFGQALGSTALAGLLSLKLRIPAPAMVPIVLAVLALIASAARMFVQPKTVPAPANASASNA